MNIEQTIAKLAASLDEEGVVALGELLQKVASESAVAGTVAVAEREQNIAKMAEELAQTCSLEEVDEALRKTAAEQEKLAEVDGVVSDCVAMGTYIGKVAFAVFMDGLKGTMKKAEDEAEEKKEEGKEESKAEEKAEDKAEAKSESKDKEEAAEEKAEEKKASLQRRIALLTNLLAGA